jgi:hypothetical protein
MENFEQSSRFSFGKHRGKTLDQIVVDDPHYIAWCMIHLAGFVIADQEMDKIRHLHPGFSLPEPAEFARKMKVAKRYNAKPFNPHAWVDLVILKALCGED